MFLLSDTLLLESPCNHPLIVILLLCLFCPSTPPVLIDGAKKQQDPSQISQQQIILARLLCRNTILVNNIKA